MGSLGEGVSRGGGMGEMTIGGVFMTIWPDEGHKTKSEKKGKI